MELICLFHRALNLRWTTRGASHLSFLFERTWTAIDGLLPFFGILWLLGIQADCRQGTPGMSYLPRSRGDSSICWAEDWARTRPFIEAAERFIGILCLVSDIRLRVSLSSLSRTGPCQTKADFQFSFTHCIVNINSLWSWYQSYVTDIDKKERKMDVDF